MRTRFCLLLAAGMIIPGAAAYAQAVMTDAECTALFSKADTNKDGSISGPELKPFETALMEGAGSGTTTGSTTSGSTSTTTTVATAPMTRDKFMSECKANKNFSTVTIP